MLPALFLALVQATTPAAPPLTLPSPSGDPAPLNPALTTPTPPSTDRAEPPAETPTAVHPAAARRARFVYKLPNGTIWDSFYYIEFRQLVSDFDALKPKSEPTGKLAAWGFKAGRRGPASGEHRPNPLWHSLQAERNSASPPFAYVNTDLFNRTAADATSHFRLGKQVDLNVYEFDLYEYPGDSLYLPKHFLFGLLRGRVEIPTTLPAKPNTGFQGEFILVPVSKHLSPLTPTIGLADKQPSHRLYPASTLRMSPADYAAALRDGKAELVEWTFKRTTKPFANPYSWTRTVIDTAKPAN